MKNALPRTLIALEIVAVVFLAACGLSLVGYQFGQKQVTMRVLAVATSVAPTALATVMPTATFAPTPMPSLTLTITPTPDPRVLLSQCGAITEPGLYRLTTDLTTRTDCISIQTSQVVLDCAGYAIRG